MRRKFNDVRRLRPGVSLILPCTMPSMHFRVVERWLWWLCARWELREQFLISFQQDKDSRDDLTSNTAYHRQTSRILARLLIKTAFTANQTLIDLGPFTVCLLNHVPNDQYHHALHLSLPTRSQSHMMEGRARLGNAGCPSKEALLPSSAGQNLSQILARQRVLYAEQFSWCPLEDDRAPLIAAFWTHINDPVCVANHIEMVLNHHHGVPAIY